MKKLISPILIFIIYIIIFVLITNNQNDLNIHESMLCKQIFLAFIYFIYFIVLFTFKKCSFKFISKLSFKNLLIMLLVAIFTAIMNVLLYTL